MAVPSWLSRWLPAQKDMVPDAGGLIGVLPGRYGSAPKRGTVELLKAYSDSPWMQAIAKRVGDATAGVEWRVYRETKKSRLPEGAAAARLARITGTKQRHAVRHQLLKQNALEPVEQHPLLDFLHKGVGRISGHEIRQLTQIMVDLSGDGFGILETNGIGQPVQWYPVPPHWVRQTPRPGGIDQFELEIPGGRTRTLVPGENIIWFCDRDPVDPYARGTGVGRVLADEIDTDEFVSRYVKNIFFNDATPSLLIWPEDGETGRGAAFDPATTKALEERWLSRLQGYLNARKPLFLNRKVGVRELQRTFEELQLVELRRWQRDVAMQVWGVSPEILGSIENSNRATIEAADFLFQSGVIVPRANKQRSVMQLQLVPKYDDPLLVLDYESPVGEDRDRKRQVYQQAPWAFRVDEHRELAGEEELEQNEGQVFPSPLGLVPSDTPLGSDTQGAPEPDATPADDPQDPPPADAPEPPKAAIAPVRKDKLTESQISAILRSVVSRDLAEEMAPAVEEALVSFGQTTLSDLGLDIAFNEASPRVVHYLRNESGSRIARINQTTLRQIRTQLVRGTEAGDSFDDLAKRVEGVFNVAAGGRSRTIARTESVRASNFGALEGMQQGGIERKQWLSSRDDRTREAHQAGIGLDGVTLPIGDPFTDPLNGSQGQHPGDFPAPASSVNCRCVLLSVVDEQAAVTSATQKTAYWKRNEARRAPWEGQLVRAVRRGFQRQKRKALRALEAAR